MPKKPPSRDAGPSPKVVDLSATSVEALLANALRYWSILFGKTRLAKKLGVTHSRLSRIVDAPEPPRLTFDLLYRIHANLGVSWTDVFVPPYLEGDTLNVVRRALESDARPVSRASVRKSEERLRARIAERVRDAGLRAVSRACTIPQATLHAYTVSAAVPLAALWRIHLGLDVPYTWLAEGKTSAEEQAFAERLGDPEDPCGRFSDLWEPIVKTASRRISMYKREGSGPWIAALEALLPKALSVPQEVRVLRLLAGWHFRMGKRPRGETLYRRAWDRLKKAGVEALPGLALGQLELADFYRLQDLFEDVFAVLSRGSVRPATEAVLSVRRAGNLLNRLEIFEAARTARLAEHKARRLAPAEGEGTLSDARYYRAAIAWALADGEEARVKIRQAESSTRMGIGGLSLLADLSFHIHVRRRELAEAERAWKRQRAFSPAFFDGDRYRHKVDLCRLRLLLLKRDVTGALSSAEGDEARALGRRLEGLKAADLGPESRCMLAVCRHLAGGDREPLRRIARLLSSGKGFPMGFPHFGLPDFLEAARAADVSTPAFRRWKASVAAKGLLWTGESYGILSPKGRS